MIVIRGKALLVIKGTHGDHAPDVHAHVQSAAGGAWSHGCAHEDLPMLVELYGLPELRPLRSLPENQALRVAISYSLVYTQDYWGECDVGLEVHKVKVLRRQHRKFPYVSKKERNHEQSRR